MQIRWNSIRIKMRPHSFGLAALALFDDDEDLVMLQLLSQLAFKRKCAHEMILSREKEGAFNLLIKKYLMTNDDKNCVLH